MKSYKYQVFFTVLIIVFAAISSCKQKPKENNISISGAFALYPLTVKWAEEYQKLHPEIIIDVSAGGAGKGMTDVLSGMVDLAMISREVSPIETTKGAFALSVSRDAVVPVISASNPYRDALLKQGITKDQFIDIYVKHTITAWKQLIPAAGNEIINIYSRSDACGAAEIWARFLGSKQESLTGTGVFGDPGIADAVKTDKLGIGYNNIIYAYDTRSRKAYDGITVVPLDMNNNGIIDKEEDFYGTLDGIMGAIAEDRFPSPPARDLYLVSKGKPVKKATLDFLKWILADGQKYVNEAGFVPLKTETVSEQKVKLSN